ncbi:MAG TPA: peptidylprolyl isomerase [Chitinophagaceae bacterium]|jgi:peptidyl-prolyl cis-trans isomerase SurA|nr:peptidylprolyl isomerase [Chitinophagaceae bacterium]
MKKIFTLSLFFLIAATFAVQGQSAKVVADKILAVIGDRIILYSDIQNTISDAVRNGNQVPENAQCVLMEQALISKILMLQAEKDSLPITEDEIEADLDNRIRKYINAYGSQEALEEIAGKSIYQIKEDARETVREQKLAEAMQRKIVENVHITPNEAKLFYEKIPKDSLPYFESELEIGQIVFYPKGNRDLEKFVMDELLNYKKQVEMKLATFEQLAQRFSEDPGSKERGGQYQVNRNDKTWDPNFLAACFRLKNEGDMIGPIKTKFGYHLIQLVQRIGDDAVIRHILRIPPVTDAEVKTALAKADTVRSKIIAGSLSFAAAATRYTEDEQAKFSGPYFLGRDGGPYVTIDLLDKDLVAMLDKLKPGEYSQPVVFEENGKKGVRIVHYKSRSEPHRLNMKDDFSRISAMALEEKKQKTLEKWMKEKVPTYYILIDDEIKNCTDLTKWIGEKQKVF